MNVRVLNINKIHKSNEYWKTEDKIINFYVFVSITFMSRIIIKKNDSVH